MKTSTRY